MFKISPVQDKATEQKYLAAVGIADDGCAFTYAMTDVESGDLMAVARFDILGNEGFISRLAEVPARNDYEAMFILARQTMNFIDTCGAHICKAAADCADERFLLAVGFKKDDNGYSADMRGMFSGNCHGCHN